MSLFTRLLDWFRALFFAKSFELSIIGLQNAGKTSIANALAGSDFQKDMIPTVGFNLRKFTHGAVTIKIWDIGGQPRFRSIWERYCVGVGAILFVIDASDRVLLPHARAELHALLAKPALMGVPLLVLSNKCDVGSHATLSDVISALQLAAIKDREVSCYETSAKTGHNVDVALAWLMKRT